MVQNSECAHYIETSIFKIKMSCVALYQNIGAYSILMPYSAHPRHWFDSHHSDILHLRLKYPQGPPRAGPHIQQGSAAVIFENGAQEMRCQFMPFSILQMSGVIICCRIFIVITLQNFRSSDFW